MDLNKTDSQLTHIVEQTSNRKTTNESATTSTMTEQAQSRNVLRVSQTPRIDISRASSSSQHEDSRDSSPENVFEQIGTGTLQEGNETDLGFGEDGTNDLRRSTEELYFVEDNEKTKEKSERESGWQSSSAQPVRNRITSARSSPTLYRFEEKQQACLQQNARKDSVSSEVAALLCISGRTSRISSVGSQGSAVSRLSAVSGVSRSPSPHKMLLETSFCGPKPLGADAAAASAIGDTITTDELEQIILARKHDVTKAVLAEGINIDLSTPKKTKSEPKSEANGNIKDEPERTVKRTQIVTDKNTVSASRGNNPVRKGGVLKKNNCTIVGVTPQGTQYIRIKLKPDELYDDKGISSNERVVEESEVSKPVSLSLKKSTTKKAAPHFTQLVHDGGSKQTDHHLTPTASPKPSRSALKNAGSRSPSPATTGISISRKSSFCSLFKAKDTASPDSPSGQRKKSAISILLDSPRDRSRSKSRESEKSGGGGGVSANSTPSKQRSILAIFKPRKNSSKSSSPIDPEMNEIMSTKQEHHSRKQTHKQEEFQQRPGSTTPRLLYYDQPKGDPHEGVRIPLHTPPDEKENVTFASSIATLAQQAAAAAVAKSTATMHVDADVIEVAPVPTPPKPKTPVSERKQTKQPITKSVVSTSTTPTATAQPKIKKSYRIELPDGSVRIPLRSPSDERNEIDEGDNNSQLWSTAVQRNSSQESQDTVISSKAASLVSGGETQANKSPVTISAVVAAQTPPITSAVEQKSKAPAKQISQEETIIVSIESANGGIRAMSKERKRILFSTKIGSGSEEQIFATQLSLSKTESLSSQLSEQVPNLSLESPSAEKSETVVRDEQKPEPIPEHSEPVVRMRSKEDRDRDRVRDTEVHAVKQEVINVNRHSMYIENIEEIMETQRRIETERKNSIVKEQQQSVESAAEPHKQSVVKPVKPERASKLGSPRSRDSTEDRRSATAGGSSGSEQDSEIDPKHRIPRQIGAVEEESAGLVSQESYDDSELPYVPTTLPEERTLGISIIPVRERALMDVKTCPLERPRSTTPLNISCLQEYCGAAALTDDIDFQRGEKLRISLPRRDVREVSSSGSRSKSPRRVSNSSGKSWFEFAEQGIGGTLSSPSNSQAKDIVDDSASRKTPKATNEWIDFENIPEKRKPAKRITTLPHKDSMMGESSHHVHYNYVNPDECQCECHGNERDAGSNNTDSEKKESLTEDQSPDDCVPLIESDPDIEENLNRNQAVEPHEQEPQSSAEAWRQQSIGLESQDNGKTMKSSFDSGGSQSPVYQRSNKTTTVQLPQRLQR
ncbi:uncharacterized protein LOC129564912 isoform X2 [Sitodiplosis mosellana]|uniref:uncharacterized protein LOC129564912 isoform X2 n=1 Tax=Sitodiplosis mosellana TaxID=263140 RepID=UPI002445090C|nr:uncharacterized protein LOC129564912 isoform X2 [Sitodiplosis mosellana]